MRYEAQERRKFVSNAQYVSEMPYKMDSESQTFTNESSGIEHGSVIKSSGNRPGLNFAIIDNISVKQKLKHNLSIKKVKKSVVDPNKVTSGEYWVHETKTFVTLLEVANWMDAFFAYINTESPELYWMRQFHKKTRVLSKLELATSSPQSPDLGHSSTRSMHTPLSFIHYRDSSSTSKGLILHCLFTIHLKTTAYWRIASVTVGISSPSDTSYIRENLRSSPRSSCLGSSSPCLFQTRFTPDLHIAYVLHDQLPLTFLVSLPAEDSEEEGDQCRICQIAGGSPTNSLLEPCGCVGSLQFVHQERLKKWLKAKINSGLDLEAVKTCELCKQNLIINVDNFNMNAHYRNHQQSWAQHKLTDSGLYLGLHHLYKRPAELMRLSHILVTRKKGRKSSKNNSVSSYLVVMSRPHCFLLRVTAVYHSSFVVKLFNPPRTREVFLSRPSFSKASR
ncbi:LOW QUALITY PROTEIN: putative E3 ubiquitin-protein ligase MARCHF10 [Morphnus guianensis]